MSMSKRKVSFTHADLIHEYEIENKNLSEENDTDYEEENQDPREVLQKLLKNRSFGNEEFGDDYESNAELKRHVEVTFNEFQQKANNSFNNAIKIPDMKSLRDTLQIEEKNDIKKIVGKEYDKNEKPCPTCSELMTVNYNNCQVCSRETVDIRCKHCVPNIFDLCSQKCREVYEGGISVIEITNDEDEPFVVIEDDGQNMVLTVTNHKIFYKELSQKDILAINKPCPNCNHVEDEDDDDEENQNQHQHPEEKSNKHSSKEEQEIMKAIKKKEKEEDIEEDNNKVKIGVVPIKCYNCSVNYSYIIGCGICYQKSGLQYLCEECENSF
jgi:hypothetical protein